MAPDPRPLFSEKPSESILYSYWYLNGNLIRLALLYCPGSILAKFLNLSAEIRSSLRTHLS